MTNKRFDKLLDTELVAKLNPTSPAFQPARRLQSSLDRFGISLEDYESMLADQGGVCAICGNPCVTRKWLCVDHDHASNKVRGLLCAKCNTGLGLLGDSAESIKRAFDYLIRTK